jgi:ribosome-binding ATPase YchF (GTP1/OBG family)
MDTLRANQFINPKDYSDQESVFLKQYNLLTAKPVLYIANIDESHIANPEENENYKKFKEYIGGKCAIIPLAIAMEYEISKLNDEEKVMFLQDLNIKEIGLNKLINATYTLLGTQTFFTFGVDETKA